MSFIERASIAIAIALWYLAIRAFLARMLEVDKGDLSERLMCWFMALHASAISLIVGVLLYRAIGWIFTGVFLL